MAARLTRARRGTGLVRSRPRGMRGVSGPGPRRVHEPAHSWRACLPRRPGRGGGLWPLRRAGKRLAGRASALRVDLDALRAPITVDALWPDGQPPRFFTLRMLLRLASANLKSLQAAGFVWGAPGVL
jgi:hypothetical protein